MKKLLLVGIGILFLLLVVVAGCTSMDKPAPGEEVSTCVTCHSDKDLLKVVANPEPEEQKSEAISGEG